MAVEYPEKEAEEAPAIKWLGIPALKDYRTSPNSSFWSNFPCRALPGAPITTVDCPALEDLLSQAKDKLTMHQYRRGLRCLGDLTRGASAAQKSELPPITVKTQAQLLSMAEC
jgi:hypothetical protein